VRKGARASEPIAADMWRLIVTGELSPGDVFTEGELCEIFNCSRTPLREALQRLAYNYLVTLPPRRGVHIAPLSILEFQQANEAMLVIYPTLAGLASERMTQQRLHEIREVMARQDRANADCQFYEVVALDHQFHTLIAKATGNQYLFDTVARLHGAAARWLYAAYQASGSAALSIAEHREILEALDSRDSPRLSKAVRDHIILAPERVLKILGATYPARIADHEQRPQGSAQDVDARGHTAHSRGV
jgi:DNA-binding GntR family transcriptional regulator